MGHFCGRSVKILGETSFHPVIVGDIWLGTCDGSLTGCDGCRILFGIEWCTFQGGLWAIFVDVL